MYVQGLIALQVITDGWLRRVLTLDGSRGQLLCDAGVPLSWNELPDYGLRAVLHCTE